LATDDHERADEAAEAPATTVNELTLEPANPSSPAPIAAPPPAADLLRDAARAAFSEGIEAYRQGDFAAALNHFEHAHALSPEPRVLVNMAKAAEAAGNRMKACRYYAEGRARGLREDPSLAALCP
jgi:tetratricopeptide (TPR) repeat protein